MTDRARHPRKRPVPVTYVGLLGIVAGLYHLAAGIQRVVERGDASRVTEGAVDITLGVFVLVVAWGALRTRTWAWAAFMTLAVIGLTHQLLRYFFYDNVNYLAMAIETIAVLALTPLDVQVAFGVRSREERQFESGTRDSGNGV